MRETDFVCSVHLALLGVLCACCLVTLAGGAQGAAGYSPGMGLDEATERRLSASLEKLVRLASDKRPDYAAVSAEIASARREAEALLKAAEGQEVRPPAAPALPEEITIPLVEGTSAEDVRGKWLGYLRYYFDSARGVLAGERVPVHEWVGWQKRNELPARARPVAEALCEAEKTAGLLARPFGGLTVARGEMLFSDDFSRGAREWLAFGECVTSSEPGAFRMRDEHVAHPDAMMWTRRQFTGDFVAEFTLIPHSEGGRAGALFTICGRPRPGKDLSVCVGESMETYNQGIDGYHFSMHRGTSGMGNARRVGPGLKMLASGPDPCPEPHRSYRVAVAKWGPSVMLLVDGKLIHCYYDAAVYGPVLDGGHIGIRHWAGMDASYRDFRVYRLMDLRSTQPSKRGEK